MGYLQVRDFPEDLHEELRLLAKKEHRSVSQQTIIAIREHVAQAADRAMAQQVVGSSNMRLIDDEVDFGTRRQKVFAWIKATPKPDLNISSEDIVQVIQEGREELDARIGR